MISESLQGTIIGGIIGFGSAMGTDIIKTWLTRPKISISHQTIEVATRPWPQTNELWIATRIKVENNGSTAAEDCKAYLIIDHDVFRIAWMIPNEDRTVIINAHDVEYIDLCAIRCENSSAYDRIFTTERGYGNTITESRNFRQLAERCINAKLKVSAKNAKQSIKNIRILSLPDSNNKIAQFQ